MGTLVIKKKHLKHSTKVTNQVVCPLSAGRQDCDTPHHQQGSSDSTDCWSADSRLVLYEHTRLWWCYSTRLFLYWAIYFLSNIIGTDWQHVWCLTKMIASQINVHPTPEIRWWRGRRSKSNLSSNHPNQHVRISSKSFANVHSSMMLF